MVANENGVGEKYRVSYIFIC